MAPWGMTVEIQFPNSLLRSFARNPAVVQWSPRSSSKRHDAFNTGWARQFAVHILGLIVQRADADE